MFHKLVFATTQGPLSPVNAASVPRFGSNWSWLNPGNIVSSNNLYAACTVDPGTNVSEYLEATNFGFTIPIGSTINGITVEIEKVSPTLTDEIVTLVLGGVNIGSNYALATNWPAPEAYVTYGSCTDLWGTSLTPTDINNSTFGIRLAYTKTICPACFSYTPEVDHIRITVCYTVSLPIDLLNFRATVLDNNKVNIHWETLSEINNNYFAIERKGESEDEWGVIGKVNGAGNSNTVRNYEFTDESPLLRGDKGGWYYCLKQVDFNGSFTYSNIISVKSKILDHQSPILIYPNPAGKELYCQVSPDEDAVTDIVITDVIGNVLMHKQTKGTHIFKLNIHGLPQGMYFLKAGSTQTRFIKE